RPRLIRDVAVGRIDDEARVDLPDTGRPLLEFLRARQRRIERMRATADRTPRALDSWLPIGPLSRQGDRHRQDHDCRAVRPHGRYAIAETEAPMKTRLVLALF